MILLPCFHRNIAHQRGDRIVLQPERVYCREWFSTVDEVRSFVAHHSPHGEPRIIPKNIKTTRWPDYCAPEVKPDYVRPDLRGYGEGTEP